MELSKTHIEGLSKAYRRLAEAWGEDVHSQRLSFLFVPHQLDVNVQSTLYSQMAFFISYSHDI